MGEKCGSSIKLMRIAEGAAHVYVRLSGICEWDIAASVAIVEAAGGHCIQLETFGHSGDNTKGDWENNGWDHHAESETSDYKDYLQCEQKTRPTLVPMKDV